ncbi:hypothetical protein BBJ28_00008373 [Nothophytophthora sp. Chile5]|nr:hypothetical protein BBJ28_00008373 [Nothophytophthora sp. Chile5]
MLSGSLWQRTLAFTPWSSVSTLVKEENNGSTIGRDAEGTASATGRLATISGKLSKVYEKVAARRGMFGVNGRYFHIILIGRELVETALQTVQAYRMSKLLPRVLLNRFYVSLLVFNCWSSVIVYSLFFRHDEARRRFACIICDCALDLVTCMGVELMIVLDYVAEYNPQLMGFEPLMWYDDEWVARALNEFQMLVVVSWADLASRSIFSLGLISTTTAIKELLRREPKRRSRVAHATATDTPPVGPRLSALMPGLQSHKFNVPVKRGNSYSDVGLHSRGSRMLLYSAHLLFGAWGVLVLGLHVYASVQPALPQCLLQVRPWAVSRPSCYLLGLDCHVLGITGKKEEVETKWQEFDSSTAVQLLVRHCPALEVPDVFNEFHLLRGIKIYNSTIEEWGASAAITHTNHPGMTYMLVVRVNMADGLLPAGFQSTDFPPTLYDLEFCVTNIRELPDDLDAKWPPGSIIQLEYSQLPIVPLVLARLEPYYLAVTGNPITELPPEVFEVAGMLYLGISDMHIRELPPQCDAASRRDFRDREIMGHCRAYFINGRSQLPCRC